MTVNEAITYTMYLLAVYLVIDSAEKLANFDSFNIGGVFSWQQLKTHQFFSKNNSYIRSALNVIFDAPCWLCILALRGVLGISLFFIATEGLLTVACFIVLFLIGSLVNLRNMPLGTETDCRLSLLITGVLLLRALYPSDIVTTAAVWALAIQSCLTYLTAGVTKLIRPHWRDGSELLNIASIPDLVPQQNIQTFVSMNKQIIMGVSWLTILIECIFPLVLFIGSPWAYLLLIWGAVFHFVNAVVFRFGKFFWVWLATYPSIILLIK